MIKWEKGIMRKGKECSKKDGSFKQKMVWNKEGWKLSKRIGGLTW